MKRIHYESWIAEVLLFFSSCETITVGPWVFTKLKEEEVPQEVRNHECTHARQWTEMTMLAGLLLLVAVLAWGVSAWWFLAVPLVYYLWYGVEYLIRLCILHDGNKAYRAVSFEQEAYANERDANYNENAKYFAWITYIGKKGAME